MAIKKMKLVKISGPSSGIDKVIKACCAVGTFRPEDASEYVSKTMGYRPLSEENPYVPKLRIINELSAAHNFSLESDEKSKKVKIDEKTELYLHEIEAKLKSLEKKRADLERRSNRCKEAIEKFSHFEGLGLDFKTIFDCKFIRFRFGRLPRYSYTKLTKGYNDNPFVLFKPCSRDEIGFWGAYFTPTDKAGEIDRLFASLQFERLMIPSAVGTAEEIIRNLNENIKIVESEIKSVDNETKRIFDESGKEIRAIYSKLLDLSVIYEAKKFAVFHKKSCFFVGWIPSGDEDLLKEKLNNYPEFSVEFEKPDEKSKVVPPTKLKNFFLFRPFEYFVEMYGLPSYHEVDITAFVAITYILLFGIMFGDLGRGIIVSLVGLFMFKKSGSGLGKILVPCGISSAFFGLVFGSVFGFEEALDPLYHKLGMSGKPLSVMESINTVLLVAISIGIALVVVAMIMSVFINIKKKKIGTALFSENGLAGIVTYVAGVSLVYRFMSQKAIIPSGIAAAMLVGGLLVLFNKEILAGSLDSGKFKKPEKLSDYIMQNFFEVIEYVLSYFSNTVSFLRVGAFVIVHASMMMVVFTLAGDPKSVGGIIVIALGNVLIIALEGLLSGIRGLRLEFYEMFSRFFEGEGKPFNPFSLASKKSTPKKSAKKSVK